VNRVPDTFATEVTKGTNGIAQLYVLHGSLLPPLPVSKNQLMDRLAKIRNMAAHDGYVPSREQAFQSVKIATEILSAARPLKIPNLVLGR
jgi:hypothetical protein